MKYIIYRISIADFIYIGSTKDLKQRKIRHKCECQSSDVKVYQMIRDNGGWDKCEMVPIEEYECNNQLQARIREEQLRIQYQANMNSIRAFRTEEEHKQDSKQYKIDNKEYLTIQNKQYYEDNKEKITQKHNCECGLTYTHTHKSAHFKTKKHQNYLAQSNIPVI